MGRFLLALVVAAGCLLAPAGRAGQDDPRLDSLFVRLKLAANEDVAARTEADIWHIWVEAKTAEANALMGRGIRAMQAGDQQTALAAFDELVKMEPGLAEAWNKRATVFYMVGRLGESMRDIERTLALEPRHFGALSGMAGILNETGDTAGALKAFEQVRAIHPRMRGLREGIAALREKLRGRGT